MIKNVLQSIIGAENFAIFSLLLFVAFFTLMLVLVMRASKKYVDKMARMPLDGDDTLADAIADTSEKAVRS